MTRPSTIVPVALGDRSYDIHIGPGLIRHAGTLIRDAVGNRPLVVLTDSAVAELHLSPLLDSLRAAGAKVLDPIIVPSGEASKDMEKLGEVMDALLSRGIERKTVLVALGGGVVGDLGGFAAAIALRGIDFIQVPTTLLSQVDSSVGGKTGINSRHGKNLIGAFHQPRLVLADTDSLKTLPKREVLAGYAEVVKYGLIDRPDFFTWLEANGQALVDGDDALLTEAIRVSCDAKADIVAKDEREGGLRELLNLGHTFGHALEAEAGYGTALLHGESVAIGMVMAFDLSVRMGLCPAGDLARVKAHLTSVGLPVSAAHLGGGAWTAEKLAAHMAKDKKVKDGRVTFILARGIGKAFRCADVALQDVKAVLAASLAT
ncbi:3-dehydroquinate synthase [Niveispirillum cyanobacteriorum]|uniref:3-dehydroquinate synthase n=1 Tax=Niveispirillum cyanobacteriorum TaxID=1612173 RepID=A0A2K9NDA9_9PROT|nr:3-dehydroquinate synthase [Niveispirillum cyanobacteriorum]AUN31131.1 3-dehydroquinate synthase [Niveispirillum cyanobacteriorum]GGE84796.1 3-dehydroquinate synthase [Niveispirillum cyanobacteriorum]